MPQFVWTVDEQGEVDYCNHHWADYSGLTFERRARRAWLQMVHPDDVDELVRRIRHSRRTSEDFEMEYRLLRARDRAWRWHLARVRLLEDASGKRKWLGTAVDIDDIKRSQKALRASEQKFRRLMDSGIIGIAFWDRDRLITEANGAFLHTVGRARDDLPGLRLEDLLAPEYREVADRAFAQIAERGVCEVFQSQHLTPDSARIPVLVGGASLEEGNGLLFALDISEQKKLEEKLRQTAKMESLGILAGGIAHDFNNLLTGILGNATLALEEAAPGSKMAELLRHVVKAGERAAALTHRWSHGIGAAFACTGVGDPGRAAADRR